MKRLSLLTLVFALVSLFFIILLVFLRIKFPAYPLVSYQDAFDVLTPLVLIPIYWLLFKQAGKESPSQKEELGFLVLAALWVEGQAMHLSANSINNLSEALARTGVVDVLSTDIYHLTYFFDEHLSHYLWHLGMVGLAALLIYREWRRPAGLPTTWWAAILAGVIYGLTYFLTFIEGNTVLLGFPFAALMTAFGLFSQRKNLGQRPVLAFFFVSLLLAFLLFVGWGIYWGGFPAPSDVGLI